MEKITMYIDLTLKLTNDHPALALFKKNEGDYVRLGHFATHLDVHQKSTVPLDYMTRRGIIIDISNIPKSDIGLGDVDISAVKMNDFVIFKTDMIKKYEYGSKDYFKKHPQLSNELIDELINKKISFIGIDAAGIRRGVEHRAADIHCEGEKVYIIENLDHLDALQAECSGTFSVTTLWIEIPGQTGLPCRVVATV